MPAQRRAKPRAEGQRQGRDQEQPRQHAIEQRRWRPQQQQRAGEAPDQRRDQ
jgi:hypothetical protein